MDYQAFPLTKTLHKQAYPAILPSQPHLSQTGKTVLITGGATGIGYAIATAFALSQADRIIIVGREQSKLDAAVTTLAQESKTGTAFEGRVCQIADPESIESLWDGLSADGVHVDVLVLNAVLSGYGKMRDLGWETVWKQFVVNVRSLHHFSDRFDQQTLKSKPVSHPRITDTVILANTWPIQKYLLNVSSGAIHEWAMATGIPSYGLTKNSATLLMQQLARETDPSDTQIISFHPGAILTPNARDGGFDETSLNWDNGKLICIV